MLIADTGPLVAMLNAKDRHHEACTALFRRFRGPPRALRRLRVAACDLIFERPPDSDNQPVGARLPRNAERALAFVTYRRQVVLL
jgi:hypothetical protein